MSLTHSQILINFGCRTITKLLTTKVTLTNILSWIKGFVIPGFGTWPVHFIDQRANKWQTNMCLQRQIERGRLAQALGLLIASVSEVVFSTQLTERGQKGEIHPQKM